MQMYHLLTEKLKKTDLTLFYLVIYGPKKGFENLTILLHMLFLYFLI
jgi:hypothetical protein